MGKLAKAYLNLEGIGVQRKCWPTPDEPASGRRPTQAAEPGAAAEPGDSRPKGTSVDFAVEHRQPPNARPERETGRGHATRGACQAGAMTDAIDQLEPMPADWTRGMAIVAHPDDVEYGASAAVAAWTNAGKEFTYVLASRGEAGIDTIAPAESAPVREAEQRASAAVVGVSAVEFLDYRDGVIENGLPLRRDLSAAIRRHRPELVVTLTHRESWARGTYLNSADHRAVGRAALDAVSDAGNRWIFPELVDQGLRPWGGVRWIAVAGSDDATHAVDIGPTLERGVASLLEHRAYIEALTDEDPETYVRNHYTRVASGAAERFGGRPAVAFEVYTR